MELPGLPAPIITSDPGAPDSHVQSYMSEPFELAGDKALEVIFSAKVSNSWAFVQGGVFPAGGSDGAPFEIESSFYSGVEDGERWSEGNSTASATLSSMPAGTYVLCADFEWDPKAAKPPPMSLTILEGGSSGTQFIFVLIALLAPAILLSLNQSAFERQRWENATLPQGN